MTSKELIKALGGAKHLAKTCDLSQPAISYWSRKGIPELRKIQLKTLFPEKAHLFDVQTVQQAPTPSGD
jgi:hypothetical protein